MSDSLTNETNNFVPSMDIYGIVEGVVANGTNRQTIPIQGTESTRRSKSDIDPLTAVGIAAYELTQNLMYGVGGRVPPCIVGFTRDGRLIELLGPEMTFSSSALSDITQIQFWTSCLVGGITPTQATGSGGGEMIGAGSHNRGMKLLADLLTALQARVTILSTYEHPINGESTWAGIYKSGPTMDGKGSQLYMRYGEASIAGEMLGPYSSVVTISAPPIELTKEIVTIGDRYLYLDPKYPYYFLGNKEKTVPFLSSWEGTGGYTIEVLDPSVYPPTGGGLYDFAWGDGLRLPFEQTRTGSILPINIRAYGPPAIGNIGRNSDSSRILGGFGLSDSFASAFKRPKVEGIELIVDYLLNRLLDEGAGLFGRGYLPIELGGDDFQYQQFSQEVITAATNFALSHPDVFVAKNPGDVFTLDSACIAVGRKTPRCIVAGVLTRALIEAGMLSVKDLYRQIQDPTKLVQKWQFESIDSTITFLEEGASADVILGDLSMMDLVVANWRPNMGNLSMSIKDPHVPNVEIPDIKPESVDELIRLFRKDPNSRMLLDFANSVIKSSKADSAKITYTGPSGEKIDLVISSIGIIANSYARLFPPKTELNRSIEVYISGLPTDEILRMNRIFSSNRVENLQERIDEAQKKYELLQRELEESMQKRDAEIRNMQELIIEMQKNPINSEFDMVAVMRSFIQSQVNYVRQAIRGHLIKKRSTRFNPANLVVGATITGIGMASAGVIERMSPGVISKPILSMMPPDALSAIRNALPKPIVEYIKTWFPRNNVEFSLVQSNLFGIENMEGPSSSSPVATVKPSSPSDIISGYYVTNIINPDPRSPYSPAISFSEYAEVNNVIHGKMSYRDYDRRVQIKEVGQVPVRLGDSVVGINAPRGITIERERLTGAYRVKGNLKTGESITIYTKESNEKLPNNIIDSDKKVLIDLDLLPDDVKQILLDIKEGSFTDSQKIALTTAFFGRRFVYNGITPGGLSYEALATLSAGICQDAALGLVIFLRAVGVPARIVQGYLDKGDGDLYQSESHAFVYAYDGHDWIGIEPQGGLFSDDYLELRDSGFRIVDRNPALRSSNIVSRQVHSPSDLAGVADFNQLNYGDGHRVLQNIANQRLPENIDNEIQRVKGRRPDGPWENLFRNGELLNAEGSEIDPRILEYLGIAGLALASGYAGYRIGQRSS